MIHNKETGTAIVPQTGKHHHLLPTAQHHLPAHATPNHTTPSPRSTPRPTHEPNNTDR